MPLYLLSQGGTEEWAAAELVPASSPEIDVERHIGDWLENNPDILPGSGRLLWIGRRGASAEAQSESFPDLLGLDQAGRLVIVALPRGRSPRDMMKQAIDEAQWAGALSLQELERIARDYWRQLGSTSGSLEEAFRETFFHGDESEPLPALNEHQLLFVVAQQIHPRVAQVAREQRELGGVDARCVAFSPYRAESGELLISVDLVEGEP